MNRRFGFGFWWIVLAVVLALGLGAVNVPTLLGIVAHQSEAAGIVTSADCGDRSAVYYSFTVGQGSFSGEAAMYDRCSRFAAAQAIDVYYDALDPSKNSITDPRAALSDEITLIFLVCLVVPPLMIWRIMRAFAARQQQLQAGPGPAARGRG